MGYLSLGRYPRDSFSSPPLPKITGVVYISEENDPDHTTEKTNGYYFTQVPHDVLEVLFTNVLPESERRVILLLLRYSIGCQRKSCFFESQVQLGKCVNISRSHINSVLESLAEKNIIESNFLNGEYEVNQNVESWGIKTLGTSETSIVLARNLYKNNYIGVPSNGTPINSNHSGLPPVPSEGTPTVPSEGTGDQCFHQSQQGFDTTPIYSSSLRGKFSEEEWLEERILLVICDIILRTDKLFDEDDIYELIKRLLRSFDIDNITSRVPLLSIKVDNLDKFMYSACVEDWRAVKANRELSSAYVKARKIVDWILRYKRDDGTIDLGVWRDSLEILLKLMKKYGDRLGVSGVSVEDIDTWLDGE